jgi:hypothetical protein
MEENNKKKNGLKIILFSFVLPFFLITITTPLHEVGHWIMSEFDPYVEPIEIHIFDEKSLIKGESIFSSAFGYVVVKERYIGAFKDRPQWFDSLQELICCFIQIILTCIIELKILKIIFNTPKGPIIKSKIKRQLI